MLSLAATSAGMAEGPRLRSSIESFGTASDLPSAVMSRSSLASSPRRIPLCTLPSVVAITTDSNPCAICLLGFTTDSSRSARESLRADAGELGADLAAGRVAAGAANLVTAHALDVGPRGEEPPAAVSIAAGEDLAKGRERIVGPLGCLVFLDLFSKFGLGSPGGRLEQVELDLGGCFTGDQAIEQLGQEPPSRFAGHRGQDRDGPLALDGRPVLEPIFEGRDRGGGIDPGKQLAERRCGSWGRA